MSGTRGKKIVTVDLSEWRKAREEAGSLDIDLGDGSPPVRLLPPELWPPAVTEALRDHPGDFDAQGRAVLGDAEYERFLAAGGTARVLDQLIRDRHELITPES